NRALNYLEWRSKDIISYFEAYPVDIPTSQNTPDNLLMTKEMATRINQAVELLPLRCKLIFKLVREDQLKYKEVAEILNISPRTVDTQMTIATKKIASTINLYLTSTR
ncbi:MAG: sigma-70 family RNA polymerase sigma factor, partial [Chitinophagaceae bacterium]